MKYVQAGILVLLLVVAGLLGALVFQQQRAAPVSEAGESQPVANLVEPVEQTRAETAVVIAPEARPEPRAPQARPKPAPPKPAPRKPAAAKIHPPAPPPEPPQPALADVAADPPPAAARRPAPTPRGASRILKPDTAQAPPPPAPREVTLPAGYEITVRLISTISSNRYQPGDGFTASLDEALVVDGLVIAEKNARVEGRVIDAQRAGRVKGRATISLDLVRLHTEDGQQIEIATQPHDREAESTVKKDAKKIGIMAGVGAAIGAIAGGGKGAAVGAGVGAGAGGATAAATRGDPVVIPSETRLTFRLTESVHVVEKI